MLASTTIILVARPEISAIRRGGLEFDLPSQAAEAALDRGQRLGSPVRKLGCVDPRSIHGDDCVVCFERKVMNGMVEVFDG